MSGESQFQTSRLLLTTAILLFCTVAMVFLLSSVKRTQLAASIQSQVRSSSEVLSSVSNASVVGGSHSQPGNGRMQAEISSDLAASHQHHNAASAESAIRPASARIVDGDNSSAHRAWNQAVASETDGVNGALSNHSLANTDHDHLLRSEIAQLRRTIEQFVAAEAAVSGARMVGSSTGNSMAPTSTLSDIQSRISQLDQAIDGLRQENRLTRELMIAHKELTSNSIAQLKDVQSKDVQAPAAKTAKVQDASASTITLNIITNDGARVQQIDTPIAGSVADGARVAGLAASGSLAADQSRPTADLPMRFAERSMAGTVSDAAPDFYATTDHQSAADALSGSYLHDSVPDTATEYSTLVIQPRGQTPKIYQHYSVPDDEVVPEPAFQDRDNTRSGNTRTDRVSPAPQPVPFSIPQNRSEDENRADSANNAVPLPEDPSEASSIKGVLPSQQIPDVPQAFLKPAPQSVEQIEMPSQVEQILPVRPEPSPFGELRPEPDAFEQQQLFPELPAQTSTQPTHVRQASAQQSSAQQSGRRHSSGQQSRAAMAVDRLAQSRQSALSAPQFQPPYPTTAVPAVPDRQQIAEAMQSRKQIARLPTAISGKSRTPSRVPSYEGIDMTKSTSADASVSSKATAAIKSDAALRNSARSPGGTMASERNQRIKQAAFDTATQTNAQAVPVLFEHKYRFSSSSDPAPVENHAPISDRRVIQPPPVPPVPAEGISVRPVPVSAATGLTQSRPPAIPIGAASRLTQTSEYSAPRQVPPVPTVVPLQRPELSPTSAAPPDGSAIPASFVNTTVSETSNVAPEDATATNAASGPGSDDGSAGGRRKRSWMPDFDAPRLPQIHLPDVRDIERPEWLQGRQMPNPIKSIRESRAVNRISSMFQMPGRQKTVD